ncbi:glycosyltransferase family 2 protein [Algihabitans albus]|uniref:glycosyltransferase family 2 protein n=1 Tax=Algihabitans albus TaxID=2164067 RepID=UPI000E5CC5DD|nr:glycosyltransferase family 2 protein [Algihabitans albus]
MSWPRVSVVIPTRDRPDCLAEAVASVLRQSHPVSEVIVVDDASRDPDATRSAVGDDPRVHLIRNDRSLGGGGTRNLGVASATGDLVAFLDDDDLWHPKKLECQVAALAGSADWQRTLVYCALQVRGRAGEIRLPAQGIGAEEDVGDYLWRRGGWMQTSSLLLPRKLAAEISFRPELAAHQDWDFVIRLAAAGVAFVFLPEPLVIYRDDHAGARISRRPDPQASLEWLESVRSLISPAAYRAFRARRAPLLARDRPLSALTAIGAAVRHGELDPLRAARLLAAFAVAFVSPVAYRALPPMRLRGAQRRVLSSSPQPSSTHLRS